MMNSVRVMVFYDGNFFKQGQIFFRYKEKRGLFRLQQLHTLFEKYVASKSKSPLDVTKVVAAHYYDGRLTTNAANDDLLAKDRDFEMALITAGIIPHYLPVKETERPSGGISLAQKGVDVELAIDVLDLAYADRYDVAILVTGDADFVPLVRKITSLNKHALIAHYSIDSWTDANGKKRSGTYCSSALIEAASWSLNFNQLVLDSDWKSDVQSLFFKPKTAESVIAQSTDPANVMARLTSAAK